MKTLTSEVFEYYVDARQHARNESLDGVAWVVEVPTGYQVISSTDIDDYPDTHVIEYIDGVEQ